MGFVGKMLTSQLEKLGISGRCTGATPARIACAAAGSIERCAKINGATIAVIAAMTDSRTTKIANARVPSLPTVPGAVPDTATSNDDTMSGITVMRIALTHIVPSGSIHPTTRVAEGEPLTEIAMPTARPSTSATSAWRADPPRAGLTVPCCYRGGSRHQCADRTDCPPAVHA